MELTLSGKNSLLKFFRLVHNPCRVFLMHTCKYFRKFFGITLRYRAYCTLILWLWIFYKIKSVLTALFIQGIARTRILKLNGSANIAGTQFVNRCLNLAANTENLRKTLFRVAVNICKVNTRCKRTAHYFKITNLANMRFYCRFKHKQRQRAATVRFNFFTCSINRGRHILYKRNHVAQKLHHSAHAHVL